MSNKHQHVLWNFPRYLWKRLLRHRNKTVYSPVFTDSPETCLFGKEYWESYYPEPQISYSFNSWGFRDKEFEPLRGKKIIACFGDSYTTNFGAPIEHSWPYQLSKHFSIPVLNFGIAGLDYYEFKVLAEKIQNNFDVQYSFVLYNILDTNDNNKNLITPFFDLSKRLPAMKQHLLIPNSIFAFVPPWIWNDEDLPILYEFFPTAHDYITLLNNVPKPSFVFLLQAENLKEMYYTMAGASWIPYEMFCELYVSGRDVLRLFSAAGDKDLIREIILRLEYSNKLQFYTNRTTRYFSYNTNKQLAEYFFSEYQKINGSHLTKIYVDVN